MISTRRLRTMQKGDVIILPASSNDMKDISAVNTHFGKCLTQKMVHIIDMKSQHVYSGIQVTCIKSIPEDKRKHNTGRPKKGKKK